MSKQIKHPTKALALKPMHGKVLLLSGSKIVGYIADITGDLAPEHKKLIPTNNTNGYKALGKNVISPPILRWIEANKEAAQQAADQIQTENAVAAEDEPYLQAMESSAAKLRLLMPKGDLLVDCVTGTDDGWPVYSYSCNGVALNEGDITLYGRACAIRDGAMGSFKTITVASINPKKLVILKKKQEQTNKKFAEHKLAHDKQLSAPVPPDALQAYHECKGDPERFSDGIDDPDYWLVVKYADAIEYQNRSK